MVLSMNFKSSAYRRKLLTNKFNTEKKSECEIIEKKQKFNWVYYFFLFKRTKNFNVHFDQFVKFLYTPKCSSSLGAVRSLFGK